MIGYLKGSITHKTPTYLYLETGGVGYHVNISLSTYGKLDDKIDALIYTHMHVREDDISLYGFYDEDERQLFIQLLSVTGIGCNTARVILSYMTTEELRRSIVHEDEFSLGKVKGIGPKTAKRIILDLKDKVMKSSGIEPSSISKSGTTSSVKDEAMAALIALGFPKSGLDKHINATLAKHGQIDQVEELIKLVLKQMN